jgi:hypothetical protein
MARVIVRSAVRRDVTIYAFSLAAIGNQTKMHRSFASLRMTLLGMTLLGTATLMGRRHDSERNYPTLAPNIAARNLGHPGEELKNRAEHPHICQQMANMGHQRISAVPEMNACVQICTESIFRERHNGSEDSRQMNFMPIPQRLSAPVVMHLPDSHFPTGLLNNVERQKNGRWRGSLLRSSTLSGPHHMVRCQRPRIYRAFQKRH